jgi:hypothetical protein
LFRNFLNMVNFFRIYFVNYKTSKILIFVQNQLSPKLLKIKIIKLCIKTTQSVIFQWNNSQKVKHQYIKVIAIFKIITTKGMWIILRIILNNIKKNKKNFQSQVKFHHKLHCKMSLIKIFISLKVILSNI